MDKTECVLKVKKRNNFSYNLLFLYIPVYLYTTIKNKVMAKTPSSQKSLTTLKLEPQMFDDFKVLCVRTKFNLSKLVDRAMHYYNNNEEFRKLMHTYKHETTGSLN